ncbi:hypothetical protein D3C71_1469850 [compost metagenome]
MWESRKSPRGQLQIDHAQFRIVSTYHFQKLLKGMGSSSSDVVDALHRSLGVQRRNMGCCAVARIHEFFLTAPEQIRVLKSGRLPCAPRLEKTFNHLPRYAGGGLRANAQHGSDSKHHCIHTVELCVRQSQMFAGHFSHRVDASWPFAHDPIGEILSNWLEWQ